MSLSMSNGRRQQRRIAGSALEICQLVWFGRVFSRFCDLRSDLHGSCKIELRQASLSVLGVCLEVCVVNTDQWSKLTGQGPVDVPPVKD
jgi:hypothetical protein